MPYASICNLDCEHTLVIVVDLYNIENRYINPYYKVDDHPPTGKSWDFRLQFSMYSFLPSWHIRAWIFDWYRINYQEFAGDLAEPNVSLQPAKGCLLFKKLGLEWSQHSLNMNFRMLQVEQTNPQTSEIRRHCLAIFGNKIPYLAAIGRLSVCSWTSKMTVAMMVMLLIMIVLKTSMVIHKDGDS